jgi:hypothetical protein
MLRTKLNELGIAVSNLIGSSQFINTKTQEEYFQLMEFYDSKGIKWIEGEKASSKNYWKQYGEDTCIETVYPYAGSRKNEARLGVGYNEINKISFKEVQKKKEKISELIKKLESF